MTIQELYEWAKWYDVENFEIKIETEYFYRLVHKKDLEIDRMNETVNIRK